MKKNYCLLSLFAILCVGIFLRFIHLANIPAELHRDELAIGYNAYSLLKSTKDEHNQGPWPINFKSFGDYKLPGQIYSTIFTIKIFGLNEFSIRFPTALFASFTLLVVYFLVLEISTNNKVALSGSALLALSFWHIQSSRNAYEPIAGLFFETLFLLFLLKGKKCKIYWLLALISFFTGTLFYNIPLLLSPFLLIGFIIIFRKTLFKNKIYLFLLILFFSLLVHFGFKISNSTNSEKNETTYFSNVDFSKKVENLQYKLTLSGINYKISQKIANKNTLIFWNITKSYFSAFNPTYLFFKGGNNQWHSMGDLTIGNFNPIIAIFLIIGLNKIFKNLKNKKYQFLLIYLLASPIPSAVTIDAPNTNRLLDFHLAILIIASIGLIKILTTKYKYKLLINFCLIILYCAFLINFLIYYFVFFKDFLHQSWHPGSKQLVKKIMKIEQDYDKIIVLNSDLYVHFLFYSAFDPNVLHREAVWKKDGFEYIESFGKYIFTRNLDQQIVVRSCQNTCLIVKQYKKDESENKNLLYIANRFGQKQWQMEAIKFH